MCGSIFTLRVQWNALTCYENWQELVWKSHCWDDVTERLHKSEGSKTLSVLLTCICLRRSVWKKKSCNRNIVTSSLPMLICVWCNMMLDQWYLIETVTLARATCNSNYVTSPHPVLICVWCNMMLGQWNLLETVTLARATYQHVWARNAEGRGEPNKRYPLRR
jgi:hypothetical protein